MGLGLAAIMPAVYAGKQKRSNLYIGIFFAVFLKYACQVLSGVYFWFPEGAAAGSLAAWIYSAWRYNLGYNLITLIVALIVIPVLVKALHSAKSSLRLEGLKESDQA